MWTSSPFRQIIQPHLVLNTMQFLINVLFISHEKNIYSNEGNSCFNYLINKINLVGLIESQAIYFFLGYLLNKNLFALECTKFDNNNISLWCCVYFDLIRRIFLLWHSLLMSKNKEIYFKKINEKMFVKF